MERKPEWIRAKLYSSKEGMKVEKLLKRLELNTVCSNAKCPNLGECYGKGTATFMILGCQCTRNCRFCNVQHGAVEDVNSEEPAKIATAVEQLNLRHVVITSVTRDDLEDGGANQFVKVIKAVRGLEKDISIEVLIPDFKGNEEALLAVIEAGPDIINHNIETIPSLYDAVRPMADYKQSLQVLKNVMVLGKGKIISKSGMMVGLGEKEEQVLEVMKDLREVGCDCLTIGQYLAPTKEHYEVRTYVTPKQFNRYKGLALELGFLFVASGPLVRSSYMADETLESIKRN